MKKIKRIGVLTSGGDAPGMNAAVRAVYRSCVNFGIDCLGIYRGWNGLINSEVKRLERHDISHIINRGGTILYSARSKEFMTEEGRKKAYATCKLFGIDGIVAIGGDGTFRGALELSKFGIPVIGIPGTIDNDISSTGYTIGFDTAANTAIDAIDKLSDTMQSHERISVVEVMGRHAGYLAIYVGLSCGAAVTLVPEEPFDMERDIVDVIREGRINGRNHFIIIVAEGVGGTHDIAHAIQEQTGMETRLTIIGHVQRGGSPTARDRVMATRMGHYAVESLLKGEKQIVVCYRDSRICSLPIEEALTMHKELDPYMVRVAREISI